MLNPDEFRAGFLQLDVYMKIQLNQLPDSSALKEDMIAWRAAPDPWRREGRNMHGFQPLMLS